MLHESRLYSSNSFITLTYDSGCLPAGPSLVKRHAVLWLKRLRRRFGKLRYFLVGEYGEQGGRPHYHAIVFGFWPEDAVNRGEFWTSESLAATWDKGFVSVGTVTAESCAYCAAYVVKKVTGPLAEEHYTRFAS